MLSEELNKNEGRGGKICSSPFRELFKRQQYRDFFLSYFCRSGVGHVLFYLLMEMSLYSNKCEFRKFESCCDRVDLIIF